MAGDVLNRVDRASFFEAFEEQHAVQYFYEPFLEAYDPALRKQLGVWYTPPEIVPYMVERVDSVLRSELDHRGRTSRSATCSYSIPAAAPAVTQSRYCDGSKRR